jgi:3-deoxy-D-manno-octulosonic-acid transferase
MGLSVFLYSLVTRIYFGAIYLFSFFKTKAKLWIEGRKNIFYSLETKISNCRPEQKRYWFHCASVGEFEQGRPLIEALKKQDPNAFIMLSFFSPSGYELRKHYSGADLITYLPADSRHNAERWFNILKPEKVFFIKYEFWYFFLKEAQRRKTDLYLVSAHFRKEQLFFSYFGKLQREMLRCFTFIFVQENSSEILLKSIGIKNVIISGDTRLDRVSKIKSEGMSLPLMHNFKGKHKVLVCGSSWPSDEKLIFEFFKNYLKQNDWKLIIAPHEIVKHKIATLKSMFEASASTLLYSEITDNVWLENTRIIIIDNLGMLNKIYAYADLAYIGGGFGKGIHNILEAAVYGIPVFFGPNNHKFQEALALKNIGQAIEIKSAGAMICTVENLDFEAIVEKSKRYFDSQNDVCKKILHKINTN